MDGPDVLWLTVGREAHDLVFARVDLEAGEVGEGRIEESERVGPAELMGKVDAISFARSVCGGRPLADAVHGENCRALEWRRIESARRVRLVVLGVENVPRVVREAVANEILGEELLLHPHRPRPEKG